MMAMSLERRRGGPAKGYRGGLGHWGKRKNNRGETGFFEGVSIGKRAAESK